MSLDERQLVVKKTFTRAQLDAMSVEDLVALVGEITPGSKFRGTGVVKRADGSVKYDADAKPGEYHETQEELTRNAERELANG